MENNKTIFDSILNTFENEDIKEFAISCIDAAPDYFYHVGASSTGKYHPQYALGEGGLVRHTLALLKLELLLVLLKRNYFLQIPYFQRNIQQIHKEKPIKYFLVNYIL